MVYKALHARIYVLHHSRYVLFEAMGHIHAKSECCPTELRSGLLYVPSVRALYIVNGNESLDITPPGQVNEIDPWPWLLMFYFAATCDDLPSHPASKGGEPRVDICFTLVRTLKCGILMVDVSH